VTALLDVITRVFVAPGEAQARPVAPSAIAAPAVAVCGPGAQPLACALALVLGRSPAVVCSWADGGRGASAPATAGARRLAASMAARGLEARATGRLVLVGLDVCASVAAAEVARASAAAGDAAVVVALCGPRDPAFDPLLAAQDLAVVASHDAPEELVRLGVAALGSQCRCAVAAPALPAVASWAARSGLWATGGSRRALAAASGALR
jgi:hypothetical protein